MAESITSGFFGAEEYLVVGTGFSMPDRDESTKGRLLVFEVTPEKRLSMCYQTEIQGAAYALAEFNGKLLNTVNSIVSSDIF